MAVFKIKNPETDAPGFYSQRYKRGMLILQFEIYTVRNNILD